MRSIIFYSPDLTLCASLLMFFNERYTVTTTTDLHTLEEILHTLSFDLLVIDAEPGDQVEALCKRMHENGRHVPIILTYVYTIKYRDKESELRNYIEAIFYKPIDLFEVTQKIEHLLHQYST
jgi:DNA-binding response OmpR family regulator